MSLSSTLFRLMLELKQKGIFLVFKRVHNHAPTNWINLCIEKLDSYFLYLLWIVVVVVTNADDCQGLTIG